MTSISSSLKSFFNFNNTESLKGGSEMKPNQQPEVAESQRQKLTKDLLLNSVKQGGLRLQRKQSDKYDEYYELASLQMFY